jgi:hypothetical protein
MILTGRIEPLTNRMGLYIIHYKLIPMLAKVSHQLYIEPL